jgi:single-strand DNA-binding protein
VAGSINKVILVGNVGNDPEIKTMQSGDRVANLSIATSESWKDKATGERKEKTEWHRVVVFNQNLVGIVESYIKKGSKVYVEGQLETRKWTDKDGNDKYTTEIVLTRFKGEITMLDSKGSSGGGFASQGQDEYGSSFGGGSAAPKASNRAPVNELEDEIPF